MAVTNLSLTLKVRGLTLHTADVTQSRAVHTECASNQVPAGRSRRAKLLCILFESPKNPVGQLVGSTCEALITCTSYLSSQPSASLSILMRK